MHKCRNCGNDLKEGAKFCSKCGNPVDGELAATEEDINTGGIIDKAYILIRSLSRYFVAAYIIGCLILATFAGRVISEYTVAVAMIGINGLGVSGVIKFLLLGVAGWCINLLKDYCEDENIPASELWVFGTKPEKREKISMILRVSSWIVKVAGVVLVIDAMIPIYKLYGFSWMLLIQIAEPFMMVIFGELLGEWSDSIAIGVNYKETKSE